MEKKRKYKMLDLNQREEIIRIFTSNEENGIQSSCSEIGKLYNVSPMTIRRIKDTQSFWKAQIKKSGERPSLKKRKRVRVSAKNVVLEETLYEWFKEKIAAGQSVSGCILKEKALFLYAKMNSDSEFKASDGWLARFKERYQLRSYFMQGEKLSTNFENSVEFVDELTSIIRLRNFQLHQIYNADETGLLWKMLPMVPFVVKYENEASGLKFSIERVTIMVCANADGSHKIPLFIIGNSKNPRCFKNVDQLPIRYERQKNAWMTRKLFKKWFMDIFLSSVRKFQNERQQRYPVLLIIDNARCHLSKEELESIDDMCSVQFLPSNMTSLIQPMNQGLIEKMKKLYRKCFLREMLLEKNENSLFQFLNKMNMKTCCIQIASAWSQLTEMNIRRSWRKLIPSCDLEVNTSVNNVSVDEFLQILYRIPGFGNITPDQVSAWLEVDANEPGWETASVEQILERITDGCQIENIKEEDTLGEPWEEKEKEDDENASEKEDELIKVDIAPSSASISDEAIQAYQGFKQFKKWFERQWECDPSHFIQLQQFNELSTDIVAHVSELNK